MYTNGVPGENTSGLNYRTYYDTYSTVKTKHNNYSDMANQQQIVLVLKTYAMVSRPESELGEAATPTNGMS